MLWPTGHPDTAERALGWLGSKERMTMEGICAWICAWGTHFLIDGSNFRENLIQFPRASG